MQILVTKGSQFVRIEVRPEDGSVARENLLHEKWYLAA
jgi:hypothetical protein